MLFTSSFHNMSMPCLRSACRAAVCVGSGSNVSVCAVKCACSARAGGVGASGSVGVARTQGGAAPSFKMPAMMSE